MMPNGISKISKLEFKNPTTLRKKPTYNINTMTITMVFNHRLLILKGDSSAREDLAVEL
ncbi:MAG: hypothetical protein ACFFAS_11495 [Promethearchaeota archaeon]